MARTHHFTRQFLYRLYITAFLFGLIGCTVVPPVAAPTSVVTPASLPTECIEQTLFATSPETLAQERLGYTHQRPDGNRLEGDTLSITAHLNGYTSHLIGSSNLDMGVAGDFDGDGQIELLLPNQARTELGGVRHTEAGAVAAWRVPLGGRMTTNLATVTLDDGTLMVGVGQDNQVLRIWGRKAVF